MKDKKVVVIGGGTGSAVILKELKKYTENITAIVTVADDGGSSGKLRKDMGILPPGDIRNCILALADDESIMTSLLNYRFEKGVFKKHSFGNLFIAAMNEISDNFPEAVSKVSEVLAIKGRVLPVTDEDVKLSAQLDNGAIIHGESKITYQAARKRSKIRKVFLSPSEAKPYPDSIKAIREADIILFSPGSLYTSIIPNLLVNNVAEEISKSKAKKFFITNLMTQDGESNGYDVGKHVSAVEKHIDEELKIFDYVLYNNAKISKEILKKYTKEKSETVTAEFSSELAEKYTFVGGNFVGIIDGRIRHNAAELMKQISLIIN